MLKPEHFGLVTTEIFGPFYIYTTYRDQDLPMGACGLHDSALPSCVVG